MPSTQPPSPLGSSEHLSAWQGCPLGCPQAGSTPFRAASETADSALAAHGGSEGSTRGDGHPSLSLMVRAGAALCWRLGCSLHHWIWDRLLPWFALISLAPARDGGCFITGRARRLPWEAAEISHQRKKPPPVAGSCPTAWPPPQGPGWRDKCLCVSVAVCVLSSPCSVGGLLSLCIVTPLTVVETATPINSSQEPRLALRFCLLIGNKLD